MCNETERYRFSQIHIDAARNATDDFNPFHDPHKWDAIQGNPFGAPIVLGFQLEALIESRVRRYREERGENPLVEENGLAFANYQLSFADVVKPGEEIRIEIKPTLDKIKASGQIANRLTARKERSPVILGYLRDSALPLVLPDADLSAMGNLRAEEDRSYPGNANYFLKRKFMNTGNGKNFLAGSLVDQHLHFDELEERVDFPETFPPALLSCALLERAQQEGYDFFKEPMVYTSHAISVDKRLLGRLKSNDCLHILVQRPEQVTDNKGLGRSAIPQVLYRCFGLVEEHRILFRARVLMARLEDVISAKR